MSHSCFSPSPFLYPLLLRCGERTLGLLRCPIHTPTSPYPRPFQGPVPYSHALRALRVSFFTLVTRCLFVPCPLGFIGRLNGSYSLVSPLLPSSKGWPWSLLFGSLTSARSRSIWRCLMTSANSFTSHRHLCLTLIAHDRSCSWVVFVWLVTSDACASEACFQKENAQ